jgi:O-antigen/teichoic acid export membrane protein
MKSIWSDSLLYFFSMILHRSLNFFLVLIFVSGLSKTDYGTYELYISVLTLISLVLTFELAQGCGRLFNEVNELQKNILFSMSFLTIIFSGILFTFLSYIGSFDSLWGYLFNSNIQSNALFLGIINIPMFGLFSFLQIQLRWEFRRLAFLLSSVLPLVLFLLFILYSFFLQELSISLLLFGNLMMNLIGCLICTYLFRARLTFSFNVDLFRQLFRFSIPFIPASILLIGILITDRFMLDWFLNRSQVGEYSFAYRVSNIAVLVFAGIQSALSPLIMKHYASEDFEGEFNKILSIFLIYSHFFLFGLVLLIPSFVNNIEVFQSYSGSLEVLIFLVPALFLSQLYIFLPGPVIAKKTSIYIYTNLISFLVNIGLNFYLIPLFGLVGAAISTLATYMIFIILLLIFSRKLFLPTVAKRLAISILIGWFVIFFLWFTPSIFIYTQNTFIRATLYLIICIFILKFNNLSLLNIFASFKESVLSTKDLQKPIS